MEIRHAAQEDIPGIVDLLKVSLGEDLMPKSEQYWRWKHVDNPFGQSPVLIAVENDSIIGVRAFMKWQWTSGGRILNAIRAVDTATHPDHQGKGIFKKLTLSLLDIAKRDGIDFVFNTPNNQSKPGYLKMGWIEAGRLPIRLNIRRPGAILMNVLNVKEKTQGEVHGTIAGTFEHPGFESLLCDHFSQNTKLITKFSREYLIWRYRDVPVANYVAVAETNNDQLNGLVIGRIKHSGMGVEFRITDIFLKKANGGKKLKLELDKVIRSLGIDFVTISGQVSPPYFAVLGLMNAKIPFGPVVTVRAVNNKELTSFHNFANWSPSLGDLELF